MHAPRLPHRAQSGAAAHQKCNLPLKCICICSLYIYIVEWQSTTGISTIKRCAHSHAARGTHLLLTQKFTFCLHSAIFCLQLEQEYNKLNYTHTYAVSLGRKYTLKWSTFQLETEGDGKPLCPRRITYKLFTLTPNQTPRPKPRAFFRDPRSRSITISLFTFFGGVSEM